jgi:hypothetical protein
VKKALGIPFFRSAVLAGAAMLLCTPGWAARDFTPQAGTWVVTDELDGKPGRGLAIDVQGNTFFMQVFGYEKNGDATFYTATGQMDGNSVTAPLMRYKGGRSFGSEARDAVEDQSLGNVRVNFRNGVAGTVQFPGEPETAIERFVVRSDDANVTNPRAQTGIRVLSMLVLDGQGDVSNQWKSELTRMSDGRFRLTLMEAQAGYYSPAFTVFEELDCELQGQRARWHCSHPNTATPANDAASYRVAALTFELVGYDLVGSVQLQGAPAGKAQTITGYNLGAHEVGGRRQEGNTTWTTSVEQNYQRGLFRRGGVCQVSCFSTENVSTLMPINGTWVVEDELTGKPGRGLALDIQGNTAILQVYHYRDNLQPSFHMGSAAYLSKGVKSMASVAAIPMDEYVGGRSVGGAKQSAQWRSQAGHAQLEFAYDIANDRSDTPPNEASLWWTVGQLQLPGESPVRIRRLQLEKPANFPEAMLGKWFLHGAKKTLELTQVVGDVVTTADGSVFCSLVSDRYDADVSCGQLAPEVGWAWHQFLQMPIMNRGGTMTRLRDRHGNAVGLGVLD